MNSCLNDGPHHWLVGNPTVGYNRPKAKGDLIETTIHTCKRCGAVRTNRLVIPAERPGPKGVLS